jgi:hypothetical protein
VITTGGLVRSGVIAGRVERRGLRVPRIKQIVEFVQKSRAMADGITHSKAIYRAIEKGL